MDEEKLNELDCEILDLYLDIQLLYHSLKYLDEDLELAAVLYSVSRVYKNVSNVRSFFN